MQLGLTFTALLASLTALSIPVEAAPVRRGQSVSLPLQQAHALRSDIPAEVQAQQHANRGLNRLARMTGREAPERRELEDNLARRMFDASTIRVGHAGAAPSKRFSRPGQVMDLATVQSKKWTVLNDGPVPATGNEEFVAHLANQLIGGKKKGAAKKGAAGAAAATGAAGAAAATDAAAANGTADAASGATAGGFSPVAAAAQAKGGLTDANTPKTKDALGLDIEANDVGYIATIQMGTPPANFKLLMDSGSADLWVGSADGCVDANSQTGQKDCGTHNFLGAKTSSSFVASTKPFQVTYGTGAVQGNIVTDNIAVAGLALKAHTFGVATQETDDFANNATPFDGLMGLAQSSLSEQAVPTPPESLASAGLISDAIVSFKIPRLQDEKNDGQITFGSADPATFVAGSDVTLKNVNTQGFWEAAMDSVAVGGTDVGLKGRTAILDSGTTLIVAPQSDVQTVLSQIPGAKADGTGNFLIPCTTSTQVALTFGGKSFAIDPRDMIFAPVDPNNLAGDCVPGISAGNIGGATEWLVGDVFLKNAIFTTDVGKNQITLATPASSG